MGFIDKLINGNEENENAAEQGDFVAESAPVRENSGAPAARPANVGVGQQYILVHPEEFKDSITVADHVISRKTVVLNVDNTGKEMARRILDVLSGTAYAVGAKIKNVSVGTYLIIPSGAEFSGDINTIDTESFKLD